MGRARRHIAPRELRFLACEGERLSLVHFDGHCGGAIKFANFTNLTKNSE